MIEYFEYCKRIISKDTKELEEMLNDRDIKAHDYILIKDEIMRRAVEAVNLTKSETSE